MFKKLLSMTLVMLGVTSVAMANPLCMETMSSINRHMLSSMQEEVMTSGVFEESLTSSICAPSEKDMPRVASKEDFQQTETFNILCDDEVTCSCIPTSWFSKIGSFVTKLVDFVVSAVKSFSVI